MGIKNKRKGLLEGLEDTIVNHAPFFIKKSNSEVMLFDNYEELYYYCMLRIALFYRRGYIEICLLLLDLWGLPYTELKNMIENWKRYDKEFENPILIKWWERPYEAYSKYCEHLFKLMHETSATLFNKAAFVRAMNHFCTCSIVSKALSAFTARGEAEEAFLKENYDYDKLLSL